MFKNFAERGDVFVNAVNNIALQNKIQLLGEVN
jgi:hypothetical protein